MQSAYTPAQYLEEQRELQRRLLDHPRPALLPDGTPSTWIIEVVLPQSSSVDKALQNPEMSQCRPDDKAKRGDYPIWVSVSLWDEENCCKARYNTNLTPTCLFEPTPLAFLKQDLDPLSPDTIGYRVPVEARPRIPLTHCRLIGGIADMILMHFDRVSFSLKAETPSKIQGQESLRVNQAKGPITYSKTDMKVYPHKLFTFDRWLAASIKPGLFDPASSRPDNVTAPHELELDPRIASFMPHAVPLPRNYCWASWFPTQILVVCFTCEKFGVDRKGVVPLVRMYRCARCEVVWYCSKDCQRTDWTRGGHKHSCKEKAREQ